MALLQLQQLHAFRPRLLDALRGYDRSRFIADLGAGVTVGVVALPLAMAFAIASGVKPEQGLFTAIIAGVLISALGGSQVQIGGPIGTRFGGIPGTLPRFELPDFSWETAKHLLIPTLTIAMLGAVESLLCARVADNLIDYPRHDSNQELMAQGVANFITPFFGGIPATGTIARTVTNVRAGATSPIAGIVHALVLLAVVLVAAPLAASVPLAVLAGVLLFVAWNMGEWNEFARLRNFSTQYRAILLGTFLLTVIFDLTVAVEVGLVMACVFFIYRMSTLFKVLPHDATTGHSLPGGVQAFELYGSLFFGAVGKIETLPALVAPGTRTLVLEMHRLVLMDTSGIDALQQLHRQLQRLSVTLVLASVNEQPRSLIRRSGFEAVIGPEHIVRDLDAVPAPSPAGD